MKESKRKLVRGIILMSGVLLVEILSPALVAAQIEQETASPPNDAARDETGQQRLGLTIQELNLQMTSLIEELKRLKSGHAALMKLWTLTLYEQREEYLRRKLDGVRAHLRRLDNRDVVLRQKLETVDRELIFTNTVLTTQKEAREQIKKQAKLELEEIALQRPALDKQVGELQEELAWVNRIRAKLKKEMRRLEQKDESPEEDDIVEPNP